MGLLASVKADAAKLLEAARQRAITKFNCDRDDEGYLHLHYYNQPDTRIPIIPFRPHQEEVQRKLFIDGVRRIYVWRPRRSGKEVESWNLLVQSAIETPGLYLMIYPTNVRARMVLWDGAIVMPDGSSLKFLDMIPKKLIVGKPNDHDMTLKLTNGSVIRVLGSDIDPDKLRGVNARGAVFSEYAFSDPRVLHILMPVFRQNNGWIYIQTTPNGMNHAYRFMKEVQTNDKWFCRIDTVETIVDKDGNRYITDEMVDEDRKSGMPEWMIAQEYYCDVQINQETLYFSREIDNLYKTEKIIPELFIPNSRVYAFYDIGWNDSTAVTLAQLDRNMNPIVIAYFENNNRTMRFYVEEARKICAQMGLMLHSHYIPHDGQKRDWNTGKNTVDFGQEMGENFIVVPKPSSKINAINQMRHMLYRTKFNKDSTGRLIECLSNYSKVYDEKHNVYKDEPLHDWSSHGVDSFQTMTLAIDSNLINVAPLEIVYINNVT
jgi:phage terminase large subunit